MKLVKLHTGTWVNPESVKAIVPLPTEQGESLHRARVVIHHAGHDVILANDFEHAKQMADEIATLINGGAK